MPDWTSDAMGFLAGELEATTAERVDYRRRLAADGTTRLDEGHLVVLPATASSSLLRVGDGGGGLRIERTDCDFLIRASLLVWGGAAFEPARGDRIWRARAGGVRRCFEVVAPPGEPAFRYMDPARTLLRVHAKFVKAE